MVPFIEVIQVTTQNVHEDQEKIFLLKNNETKVINESFAVLSRTERSVKRGKKAERSANLSHITGATRKIQLYIKNRFLQLLPDGSVNGTHDDTSDYSKFLLKCFIWW